VGGIKVRIAIDARTKLHCGIGTYTTKLIDMIPQIDSTTKIFPINDNISFSGERFISKCIGGVKRLIYDQINMNMWLKQNDIDILHNPRNIGLPFWCNCKAVVTIHDIIPHVYSDRYLRSKIEKYYYLLMVNSSISRSEKIITDSFFSKNELIKYFNIDEKKISVIYLGCSNEFIKLKNEVAAKEMLKKMGVKRKYILTIGGSEYRKNVRRLIDVYKEKFSEQYDLVVIGGKWHEIDLESETKNVPHIYFVGAPSQEDLVNLYSLAKLFVFPSLYEGFGLPVLEAMSCGVPVVTSNTSSIPEVAGDAALLFNPYDMQQMYQEIKKGLEDGGLRQDLICRGYDRVKKFSWEKTANETLDVYHQAFRL